MRGWLVSRSLEHLMRHLRVLTVFPLVLLIVAGCSSGDGQPESIVVEVTGDEFNWYFRYPGPDGELGTSDDRHSVQNLYLPTNSQVELKLNSNDYIYNFTVPDLDLQEIAVPELDFGLQFSTTDEQTLELLGDQMCGFAHETLIGKVYVRKSGSDFYDW